MKILNFIVYSTLSVVIVSNSGYTMNNRNGQEDMPKMDYFDLDNNNNNQQVELQQNQQEIDNLQKQVDEKEHEIKDWLEHNTINQKFSIDEHLDFIRKTLYSEEQIRSDILHFNSNAIFKYFDDIGLHDIVNNHIVELCNIISLSDIHKQLYNFQHYFQIINYHDSDTIEYNTDSFEKQVLRSYVKQLENILKNNNKYDLFHDIVYPILCNNSSDCKMKCARESIIRLSKRLAECRYLFGCMNLICQYFELKDKINEAKEKLE